MYWFRVPPAIRDWLPKGLWEIPPGIQLSVYLTFDDGPHPEVTPFVLDLLSQYGAKATFFCLGKNVQQHPDIYDRILREGHQVGNHTFNHLNGWKTGAVKYMEDIRLAGRWISSRLFRPPYGRLRKKQARLLTAEGMQVVYWSLLSGDFDRELRPSQCLQQVLGRIEPGSIVVFHDSEKAWDRLQYVLPRVLEFCCRQGWQFKSL